MEVLATRAAWQRALEAHRRAGSTIGFVPTMGALHAGHISLVEAARQSCDVVTSSIFVNPLQFGDASDLERYPRTLAADSALLEEAGCDLVFTPPVEEMYPTLPTPMTTSVVAAGAALGLEAEERPGHFDGVVTVLTLLFNLVGQSTAYFGEKDFQQLAVVRQLVADLSFPVEIVGCPTIREPDGLAMSSRNVRLSPAGRVAATVLSAALAVGARAIEDGAGPSAAEAAMVATIEAEPQAALSYACVVDPTTLVRLSTMANGQACRLLIAAVIDGVRLIDNRGAIQQSQGS